MFDRLGASCLEHAQTSQGKMAPRIARLAFQGFPEERFGNRESGANAGLAGDHQRGDVEVFRYHCERGGIAAAHVLVQGLVDGGMDLLIQGLQQHYSEISSSSTSKIRVALGPIGPPPFGP